METYKKQLIDSGLTAHQATLYELLIRNGGMRASSIVRQLGSTLSRPMVYAVLTELVGLGLVEKNEIDTKVARFLPAHPTRLQDIAKERQMRADLVAQAASAIIPRIVSDYNLVSSKPSVRFFEGRIGVSFVLKDSLKTQTPILSYTDVEIIEKHYKDVGDPYLKERARLGIHKKLLLDDTPFVRALYRVGDEASSEVRLIPRHENPYPVAMQIYDDKVTYLTLIPGNEVAVIIQNPHIADMHRRLFEELYNRATPLSSTPATIVDSSSG